MKGKLFISGGLILLLTGCFSPAWLPHHRDIGLSPRGSLIQVRCKNNIYAKGELITASDSAMIVLSETGKPFFLNRKDIISYRLRYAKPKNYGWTIPVFTLATIAHGYFFVLTAPVNLITTIAVTASGANAYTYKKKDISYDDLKMFARFPGGLPPGMDYTQLKE